MAQVAVVVVQRNRTKRIFMSTVVGIDGIDGTAS